MADAALDRLLDALECCTLAGVDAFGDSDPWSGTDDLILGRCSADGYAMIQDSVDGHAWRPWSVGQGVLCPADGRTYMSGSGLRKIGNCQPATFEHWKPGKR